MSFFNSLGSALTAYQERASRADQIERLQSMSDAQLRARGISRDRIVHHVFRDIVGL